LTDPPAIPGCTDILYRVIDGNQKQVYAQDQKKSSLYFKGLPFFNNFGDNYTVLFLRTATGKQVSLPSSSPRDFQQGRPHAYSR